MQHILAERPFISIQGEGMWAGRPSIFIRYAGCNLRCQFGLKCENHSASRDIPDYIQEVIDNLDHYTDVKDLPVFPNYCDTYIGILPEFKRFWVTYNSTEELAAEIYKLIEDKPAYQDLSDVDLVFTGGEPLLHQDKIIDLLEYLKKQPYGKNAQNVSYETNGTIVISKENMKRFKEYSMHNEVTFSISPKISSANYSFNETCKAHVPANLEQVSSFTILKFVVKEEADIKMVKEFTETYQRTGWIGDGVFLMPCGGKADPDFDQTQITVFDLCVKYGYNFSPRLQMIKKNAWAV